MSKRATPSHAPAIPHEEVERLEPRWAVALVNACTRLSERPPLDLRNPLRISAWPVLRVALAGFIRIHSSRHGPLSEEAVDDLAADKSLRLLLRCESGAWNPVGWSGFRMAAFLSRVARNGVIDQLRASGPHRIAASSPEEFESSVSASHSTREHNPADQLEAAEYAGHLLQGIQSLKPRARTVWFLRVCFDWPSRRIAAFPGVQIPASHVDVELQRTRSRIRAWMEAAGFDAGKMPPGTFTALWSACLLNGSIPVTGDGPGEAP